VAIAGYWRRQGLAVDLLVLAAEGADANAFRELARAPVPKALGRTLVLEERELAPGGEAPRAQHQDDYAERHERQEDLEQRSAAHGREDRTVTSTREGSFGVCQIRWVSA